MAEPLSLGLGLVSLVTLAFEASRSLHQEIEAFKSQQRQVRDLTDELAALTEALASLKHLVNSASTLNLTSLALLLNRCRASCIYYHDELQKCIARSGCNEPFFRDWDRVKYVGEDIDGFKQLISCYKSTVRIALTSITLRTNDITAGRLVIYKELLSNAQAELEDRLRTTNNRLELLQHGTLHGSYSGETEAAQIKDEQSNTEQCLELCAEFSQHISEVQRTSRPSIMDDTKTTAEMACILLVDGTRIDSAQQIGTGIDGIIVRMGHNVLKAPKLLGYIAPDGNIRPDDDNELHVEDLDVEKQVYSRLGKAPGIAECIEITPNGILLKYYPMGSLDIYMAQHKEPALAVRIGWVLQVADALKHCHDNDVLVFDIALRNLLVTDEFTLRMIDFANSSLLPKATDTDISKANEDGSTVALDLLHFSNVIYSIVTWQDFHIECAMESEWPDTDSMPDMRGLAISYIIQSCWMKEYATIDNLIRDLQHFSTRPYLTSTADAYTTNDQSALSAAQPDR